MTTLKRLVLEGFKSYGPQRVELPLSRGFNAVIGPNGSGKSNVVDALLFVLGGLSTKSMRAASLTDLIFAGTPEEKPSRRTRVEIVLDNADHKIPINADEIQISREVRRSGSSVYRFNGVVSTRKEIVDILALGNIGAQERNIVQQGEIVHLILMSPQERRELVESVAGITEFDEKRIEAEKELEKTRSRYREIDLILGALRETRERLAREKEEAEKYIRLQLEIEKKTALLLAVRATQLETKLESLNKARDLHQKNLASHQDKRIQLELEKDKLVGQLNSFEQKYSDLQERELVNLFSLSDATRAEKTELESKIAFEQEKIGQYQKEHKVQVRKVQELCEAREQLIPQEATLTDELSEVSRQLEEKTTVFMDLRKKLEDLDNALEHDRQQVRKITKDVEENKKQLIECEARKKFLNSILQSNTDLLIDIKTKRDNLQVSLRNLEDELVLLAKQQVEAIESLKQTRTQVESLKEQKITLEEKLKTLLTEHNKTEFDKIQLETELRVLREEKTEVALTAAADAILLASKRGEFETQDIHGPISTLFNFPLKLQQLLNTTFPTLMAAIIVPDVKSAAEIAEFAKKNHLGQIVIFIKELFKKNITKTSSPTSLMAFADCSEANKALGAHLFGNIYLINDLGTLQIDSNNIYLTRQGEIIDATRACVIGVDTGLARISELQDELIPRLQVTFKAESQQKLQFEQELSNLSRKISGLDEHLRVKEARFTELNQKDRILRDELERTRARLHELTQQATELERQDKESRNELSKLDAIITELSPQLPRLESKLTKLTANLEGGARRELEPQLDQLRDELDELRLEDKELRLEFDKIQTRKNELIEPGIQNGGLRQEEILRQIEATKDLIASLSQKRQQTEKELEDLTSKIETTRNQMTHISEQRDSLRQAHNTLSEQLTNSQQAINKVQQAINKIELETTQYITELKTVRQNAARIETPRQFDIETLSSSDPAIIRQELLQHQRDKDELGSVNLKAPEQFVEIDTRYNEILTKRETLKQERKVILETIDELERKKRKTFLSTFEHLNKNFNLIFKRLSPGPESYAQLLLENPQNPFEGGVQIEARPQGKRIKSIASMSGGEKSIAALALLFAIQKVESNPFYVFDEIDAFLDSANVHRVAELLSELSEETQILLVTLREPMMALADRLYAVSLIDGISCVFGIQLQEILDGKIQLEKGEDESKAVQEETLVDSRI